jgi:hypothetical protein
MTLFRNDHGSTIVILLAIGFFVAQGQIENPSVLDRQPLEFAELA